MKGMGCQMKKALIITGLFVLAVVVFIVATDNSRALSNQDYFVRTIELPYTVEMIAVRSAIGDSGGNGNFNTLRSVMLVRTELPREYLVDVFIDLDFRLGFNPFNRDGNPDYPRIWIIREPDGYQFRSPRGFRLDFEELKGMNEFCGYFFVEFIS